MVCLVAVERGRRVLAVDTDSNADLAMALGLGDVPAGRAPLVPRSLVVGPGRELPPAQLPADYGRSAPSGVTVLRALRVEQAPSAKVAAARPPARSLLDAALDQEADLSLIDMEAGLEHVGKCGGTLARADVLAVVMEPSRSSMRTMGATVALARGLGIPRLAGVGNKGSHPDDPAWFAEVCAQHDVPLAGIVPYDPEIVAADRIGMRVGVPPGPARAAIEGVVDFLDAPETQRAALEAQRARIEARLAQLGAAV